MRSTRRRAGADARGDSLHAALDNFQRDDEADARVVDAAGGGAGQRPTTGSSRSTASRRGRCRWPRALDRVRVERPRGKECYLLARRLLRVAADRGGARVRAGAAQAAAADSGGAAAPGDGPAGGHQVADGQAGRDEVADGAAGGGEVADGSARRGEVADGAAAGAEVADGAAAGGEVADGIAAGGEVADGPQPALKSPTGQQPALKGPSGSLPTVKSPTGQQPALRGPSGNMNVVKAPSDLPSMESGPLGTPGALLPSLETRAGAAADAQGDEAPPLSPWRRCPTAGRRRCRRSRRR